MKSPVALSPLWTRPARWLTVGLLVAAVPCLGGCPGSLEGDFSSITNSDSGASNGSGGDPGSGGTTVSTGGTVGSGGVVGSGGTVGSGGMVGSGGIMATAGKTGTAGKSGTGGMVAAGGHGGTKANGGSTGTATCDAPTMIFKDATVGCLGGGCHSAGAQNTKPDLQTADPTVLKAYKTTMLCMGGTLVVPANPTTSVLYKVVDGTSCGAQMPLGKPTLSDAQEACLAAWISNL